MTCGYDSGMKIKGQKRHIATDTLGLLLRVLVTSAAVQDRDGAHSLLVRLREKFSTIAVVWADGGYAGRLSHLGARCCAPDGRRRQAQ